MEKYLKIALGVIVLIIVIQLALFVLPWVIGGILVLWLVGWIYFKFIRKYVIKYKQRKGETEEFTYTFTKGDERKTESEYEDDGPVIDVDYEEVKDDK